VERSGTGGATEDSSTAKAKTEARAKPGQRRPAVNEVENIA
jgi:hypothetical protein